MSKMRLHVGAGSVYLKNWMNVDLPGPKSFLAVDRPDLVEKLGTTDDDYYARHRDKSIDTLRKGPLDQEMVCDYFADFSNLPCPAGGASEVLSVHVFEHMSLREAHHALDQIDSALEPGGVLRLAVPDHDKTLDLYRDTGDEFYRRHLLGSRRNQFGYHVCGYSRERLRELVEDHGFIFECELPSINLYPSIFLKFRKPGPQATTEYAWPRPYEIPASWRVLEIGPGSFPLKRADVYLDHDMDRLTPLRDQGKAIIHANLDDGLPNVESGSFDYCWVSHVLEHVRNVPQCIAALNRIAKYGTMIVPSWLKEGLFGGQEESDHKYFVAKSYDGIPVFIRHNAEFMHALKDPDVEKVTSRLYRTGPNRLPESRYCRSWFYQHEKDLDIDIDWSPERPLRAMVIEKAEDWVNQLQMVGA